jgi:phage virion morphogenesis protein
MAGATLTVQFQPGRTLQALRTLEAVTGRPAALLRAIGTGLLRNAQDRFEEARAPDGSAWAPLQPFYLEVKRGPGILRGAGMRGGLQGSLTMDSDDRSVVVGSARVYAAAHQFGATIRPRAAKVLLFRTARGRVWGAAKEVTIPARPYLGLSRQDEETILDVTETVLQRALGRG